MLEQITVLITAGSIEEGRKIANALVEEGLAACITIIPQVNSPLAPPLSFIPPQKMSLFPTLVLP